MSHFSVWDAQTDPRLQRVNEALRPVVARTGVAAVNGMTPLMEVDMLEQAAELTGDDEFEQGMVEGRGVGRVEGFQGALRMIFEDGYHPAVAVRRLYCLAQRMAPELIAEMSYADLASMWGETRQAVEARMEKMFEGSGVRGRDQKRSRSAQKMSKAQMGNDSRKQGKMKERIMSSDQEKG